MATSHDLLCICRTIEVVESNQLYLQVRELLTVAGRWQRMFVSIATDAILCVHHVQRRTRRLRILRDCTITVKADILEYVDSHPASFTKIIQLRTVTRLENELNAISFYTSARSYYWQFGNVSSASYVYRILQQLVNL